jgi:putative tricarboxylic transport membrane protein
MLDSAIQGLLYVLSPSFLFVMIAGIIISLIFGVIPAISGLTLLVLALPIIYGMDPMFTLPLILACTSISVIGGSITAILINIPGDTPNAATLFDGFPMTQKGEAGRALGAALTSGGLGGLLSALLAFVSIPLVAPIVLAFHMPELFFTVILGLVFIGVLSEEEKIKGLISGCLGLLLAFVGIQAGTGMSRYDLGMDYLVGGISLVPVTMGLFAGSELIELAVSGKPITQTSSEASLRQMFIGFKDVFRNLWLWFRCVIIGYIVGVIPGIGQSVAVFIAYGQAKQTSKHPEKFGTGVVEGVIAPEAANNAVTGGALLTTLTFGIPGSGPMALLLAAFVLTGIRPGPEMLTKNLTLSFTIIWALAIACLIATIIAFFTAPFLMKVTKIHPHYLQAVIVPVMFVAAFTVDSTMASIILTLIFTGVGALMKYLGYSRPTFLIGFVLGLLFEQYFWFAFKLGGPWFFLTPISLFLIAVTVVLLSYSSVKTLFRKLLIKETTNAT